MSMDEKKLKLIVSKFGSYTEVWKEADEVAAFEKKDRDGDIRQKWTIFFRMEKRKAKCGLTRFICNGVGSISILTHLSNLRSLVYTMILSSRMTEGASGHSAIYWDVRKTIYRSS